MRTLKKIAGPTNLRLTKLKTGSTIVFCRVSVNATHIEVISTNLYRGKRGSFCKIMRVDALKRAFYEAQTAPEKEHVTPYIWKHPELFRLANLQQTINQSSYRLTVDTQEDLELVERIFAALYPKKPEFTLKDGKRQTKPCCGKFEAIVLLAKRASDLEGALLVSARCGS